MNNIPVYRAKKIDGDVYVEGNLINDRDNFYILNIRFLPSLSLPMERLVQIDPSTLSIHFPDMIAKDSNRLLPNGEKDLRIFASLSESGKGGDITLTKDGKGLYKRVHLIDSQGIVLGIDLEKVQSIRKYNSVLNIKVIGIQE